MELFFAIIGALSTIGCVSYLIYFIINEHERIKSIESHLNAHFDFINNKIGKTEFSWLEKRVKTLEDERI